MVATIEGGGGGGATCPGTDLITDSGVSAEGGAGGGKGVSIGGIDPSFLSVPYQYATDGIFMTL
jgi:hypothetical protein